MPFGRSSPRVWGQGAQACQREQRKRIIPTRVGTSGSPALFPPRLRDHPHACGDKVFAGTAEKEKSGSSPRVWGQVKKVLTNGRFCGIIPTRVGTSQTCLCRYGKGEDHPHACGDKFRLNFRARSIEGSSPRVWGQETSLLTNATQKRIIPTRVGTSFFPSSQ